MLRHLGVLDGGCGGVLHLPWSDIPVLMTLYLVSICEHMSFACDSLFMA